MRIVPMLLGILLITGNVSALRAMPPPQRADRLDQPLLGANMCGAGDPGDVQFTLAATGDTFPHENIQAFGRIRCNHKLVNFSNNASTTCWRG